MNRRWRNLVQRRQRRFDPPWPAASAPPSVKIPDFRDRGGARPRWFLLARRGRFGQVPPNPPVAPSAFVPSFREPAGVRPRWVPLARRGKFQPVPPAAPAAAASGPLAPAVRRQPRRPQVPARRGEFFSLSWPQQVTPVAPSFVPRQIRRRTQARLIRSGEFLLVPPTPTQVAPKLTPKLLRATPRRLVVTRSGSFLTVPLVGAPVAPPAADFVCQDLDGVIATVAYGGVRSSVALGGGRTVVALAGAAHPVALGGTASICGR